MDDCIFCKIVKGEVPSYSVYEDDQVKVFLDINPNTNGDMLIISKKHYDNLLDIDKDVLTHIHILAKELYPKMKKYLKCDGLTISQNNEYSQEVRHYHLHMTPRYKEDGCKISYDKSKLKNIEEVFDMLKK